MKKLTYILLLVTLVQSCNLFNDSETQNNIVARVNDSYLYTTDIENIIPNDASKEDSILIVNTYINRWASQRLLMDGALVNLSETKQNEFEKLVNQYKTDLYTNAYLEGLVKKNIDSSVTKQEAKTFYNINKESFKLNDDIIQFRYICLPKNNINIDTISKCLKRFETEDKNYLDSISIQYKSYTLNDSIWVKLSQVINKIPKINTENKDELLKKSNFLQLKDSLNLYLMTVKDVRLYNDYAPLDYVKPSIEQIVINKRKLELIKQLENDITKDAIKNNQFQIYN